MILEDYVSSRLKDIFGPITFLRYESGVFFNENAEVCYSQIKEKFSLFRKEFDSKLEREIGTCKEVEVLGNSDFHFEGKCVVKFSKKGKTYYYKPKLFKHEHQIKKIFDDLFEVIGEEIIILPELEKTGDSFIQESIVTSNNDDIYKWMHNLGSTLVVLKLLGLNDLHEENIVISNNKLVIIDFETIFNFNFWRGNIIDKYQEHNSLALTNFDLLNTLLFDLSNYEINLVRITKEFYKLDQFNLSSDKYNKFINNGICHCIDLIKKNKNSVSQLLLNNTARKFRLLLRPTLFYDKLIKKHFSYDYIKLNADDRKDRIFKILDSESKINIDILLSEYNSIIQGDIPIFYADLNGNIFDYSLKKIYCIKVDFNTILYSSFQDLDNIQNEFNWLLKRLYLKNYTTLVNDIIVNKHFSSSSIFNCHDTVGNFRLEIMGLDLYDGLPGFILSLKNQSTFKAICINYIDFILQKKERLFNIPNGGCYVGMGSFLLFLLIVKKITNSKTYDAAIKCVYNIIESNSITNNKKNDLMAGNIGLIVILAVHNKVFNCHDSKILTNSILDINDKCISYLKTGDIGLAHGKAGLLMSITKLYELGYNINKETIVKLQNFFISIYSYKNRNWETNRTHSNENHSWCNGGVGISLALSESLKSIWNANLNQILKHYFENEFDTKYVYDHICCGFAGSTIISKERSITTNSRTVRIPYEKDSGIPNLSFFFGRSGLKYYEGITKFEPCLLRLSNLI